MVLPHTHTTLRFTWLCRFLLITTGWLRLVGLTRSLAVVTIAGSYVRSPCGCRSPVAGYTCSVVHYLGSGLPTFCRLPLHGYVRHYHTATRLPCRFAHTLFVGSHLHTRCLATVVVRVTAFLVAVAVCLRCVADHVARFLRLHTRAFWTHATLPRSSTRALLPYRACRLPRFTLLLVTHCHYTATHLPRTRSGSTHTAYARLPRSSPFLPPHFTAHGSHGSRGCRTRTTFAYRISAVTTHLPFPAPLRILVATLGSYTFSHTVRFVYGLRFFTTLLPHCGLRYTRSVAYTLYHAVTHYAVPYLYRLHRLHVLGSRYRWFCSYTFCYLPAAVYVHYATRLRRLPITVDYTHPVLDSVTRLLLHAAFLVTGCLRLRFTGLHTHTFACGCRIRCHVTRLLHGYAFYTRFVIYIRLRTLRLRFCVWIHTRGFLRFWLYGLRSAFYHTHTHTLRSAAVAARCCYATTPLRFTLFRLPTGYVTPVGCYSSADYRPPYYCRTLLPACVPGYGWFPLPFCGYVTSPVRSRSRFIFCGYGLPRPGYRATTHHTARSPWVGLVTTHAHVLRLRYSLILRLRLPARLFVPVVYRLPFLHVWLRWLLRLRWLPFTRGSAGYRLRTVAFFTRFVNTTFWFAVGLPRRTFTRLLPVYGCVAPRMRLPGCWLRLPVTHTARLRFICCRFDSGRCTAVTRYRLRLRCYHLFTVLPVGFSRYVATTVAFVLVTVTWIATLSRSCGSPALLPHLRLPTCRSYAVCGSRFTGLCRLFTLRGCVTRCTRLHATHAGSLPHRLRFTVLRLLRCSRFGSVTTPCGSAFGLLPTHTFCRSRHFGCVVRVTTRLLHVPAVLPHAFTDTHVCHVCGLLRSAVTVA